MNIEALNLSGFKNFDLDTKLNFRDEHKNIIFDADDEIKYFVFEAILGVIFGLDSHEKLQFKSAD